MLPRNLSIDTSLDCDIRRRIACEFIMIRLKQVLTDNRKAEVLSGAPCELRICSGVSPNRLRWQAAYISECEIQTKSLLDVQSG